MSKVVALTGGIGSGKTEACHIFAELDVPVVDLDKIAHAMSAPGSPAMQLVRQAFGDHMFQSNGQLDRARLREQVFSDPQALNTLNNIMHPAIHHEAIRQMQAYTNTPYLILAIPLLVESREQWDMIDHVLVIDCREETQLARVMARSPLSQDIASAMIASQSRRDERLALADSVINNDQTLEALREKVIEFHKKYANTCQS